VAAVSGTTSLTIRYTPTAVGTDTCTVSIANNSWATPYTFMIRGRGIAAPGAPTTVSATAGNAQATVSWSVPASNGNDPISNYTVTSSPGSRTCTTTGATACTVTGLTNGTAYTFAVTAKNGAGTGPAGTSNSVTPRTVPGVPTNVSATPGDAQATVNWGVPSSNGGAAITGYSATSTPDGLTCTTTGATACTVTGLSNGTAYTFAVIATNGAGSGPAGTSNSVTPLASTFTVTPGASGHGSISPDTPVSVARGGTGTFTLTPEADYSVTVAGCGGALNGLIYTTAAIEGDCAVSAVFVPSDLDQNGIPDAIDRGLKANLGISSSEVSPLAIPATGTAAAWVKLKDVERVPFCLFAVDASGAVSYYCLTITSNGNAGGGSAQGAALAAVAGATATATATGTGTTATARVTDQDGHVMERTDVPVTDDGLLFVSASVDNGVGTIGAGGPDLRDPDRPADHGRGAGRGRPGSEPERQGEALDDCGGRGRKRCHADCRCRY